MGEFALKKTPRAVGSVRGGGFLWGFSAEVGPLYLYLLTL